MTQTNPPRFVPTLTETLTDGNIPSTVSDDSRYLQQRRLQEPDSMLDLDLGDGGLRNVLADHLADLAIFLQQICVATSLGEPAGLPVLDEPETEAVGMYFATQVVLLSSQQ